MSAPLPSEYQDGFSDNDPILYVIRLAPAGAAPMYLVNQPGIINLGLPRGISYDGVDLTDDELFPTHLPAFMDEQPVSFLGDMDFAFHFDDVGGIATVGETTVSLMNLETFIQTLFAYDIDNAPIEIWQGYLTPTAGTIRIDVDCVLLFKGVVHELAGWDRRYVRLLCYDTLHRDSRQLPHRIITKTLYPNAPDSLVDKPIPILFGVYESTSVWINDYAPTVTTDNKNMNIYPSGVPWDGAARFLYIDSEEPWRARIQSGNVSYETDDQGVVYGVIEPDARAEVYLHPTVKQNETTLAVDPDTSEVPDFAWAVDDDETNYVRLYADSVLSVVAGDFTSPGALVGDGFGGTTDLKLFIDVGDIDVGTVEAFDRIILTGTELSLGMLSANTLNVFNYNLSAGGSGSGFTETWESTKYRGIVLRQAGGATSSAYIKNIYWRGETIADLARTRTVRVVDHFLAVRHSPSRSRFVYREEIVPARGQTNMFVTVTSGAMYGSWITGRGYSDGDPIENIAGAIEYLLRDLLGVDSASIDTDSFDVVGNSTDGTRKDWLLAGSIDTLQNSIQHFGQMCKEHGVVLFIDPDTTSGEARYRLISLPDSDSAVTLAIDESHIHLTDDGEFSHFEFNMTPRGGVVNDLRLNYQKDPATNQPRKSVYVSAVDGDGLETNLTDDSGSPRADGAYSTWMGESQTKYGTIAPLTIDSEWIRDEATANLCLKLNMDWRAFRRMRVTLNVLRSLDTLGLRIGDVITITHPLLTSLHTGVTKFMITGTRFPAVGLYTEPYITLTAEEIPNAYTGTRVVVGLAAITTGGMVVD